MQLDWIGGMDSIYKLYLIDIVKDEMRTVNPFDTENSKTAGIALYHCLPKSEGGFGERYASAYASAYRVVER